MKIERPRILLIGTTGQVGWELVRTLQPLGEVICAARHGASYRADLAHPETLRDLVRAAAPNVIVNAAAYTAVDRAEDEAALAHSVNATAPGVLAEEAAHCGAALIHYSTDYVFDGKADRPYRETDATAPLSVYGHSKLAGEQAIAQTDAAYLILRTSWVYATRGSNFLLTIRRLARERPELRVINDQYGAPTWARLIAEATGHIIARGQRDVAGYVRERRGIYHLTNGGITTWFDFASAIVAAMPSDQPRARVIAIPSSDYPTKAQRPAYSVLDNTRMRDTFGMALPDWREALGLALDI